MCNDDDDEYLHTSMRAVHTKYLAKVDLYYYDQVEETLYEKSYTQFIWEIIYL